jgi:hypothetical protein
LNSMTTISARILMLLLVPCWLTGCGPAPEPAAGLSDQTRAELQARIDGLDRGIESALALRAIKRLQWAYGHYSEFGLWHDFADLFADTGIGHYTQGDLDRDAIRTLFFDQVGQGQLGLATGRIYPHISFSPVLSLAGDGRHARGRFRILAMLGGYGGNALWFHGVYENAYVNERGVWKINEISNAAQVSGTFAAGLSSPVRDEPAIALHFAAETVGRFALPDQSPDASESETGTAGAGTAAAQLLLPDFSLGQNSHGVVLGPDRDGTTATPRPDTGRRFSRPDPSNFVTRPHQKRDSLPPVSKMFINAGSVHRTTCESEDALQGALRRCHPPLLSAHLHL